MPELFTYFYQYYFIVLILQAICVIHSIRKGNQQKWIWIIVFVPLIGCIAYLFTEILKRRHVDNIQSGVAKVINPTGRFKELEKKFNFSDTFANRVALADEYLAIKNYTKAIELYEPALRGLFQNNEHVIKQLIFAYYQINNYATIVKIAPGVLNTLDFTKSNTNLLYALALEETGNIKEAEKEYNKMNQRFLNYESRFKFGEFLLKQNRPNDASILWEEIVNEGKHMNRAEKSKYGFWIGKAGEALNQLLK